MSRKKISGGVVHEIPADLRKALASDPQALTAWEDITPLARNEWICWIESAKKAETRSRRIAWVVYAKPPFGGPEHVLQYLARYTHRVAISNHRLLSVDNNQVCFRWKDYAHHNKRRTLTLSHEEFLRRFLQHVLPKGFPRIRYFGWLANRRRGRL